MLLRILVNILRGVLLGWWVYIVGNVICSNGRCILFFRVIYCVFGNVIGWGLGFFIVGLWGILLKYFLIYVFVLVILMLFLMVSIVLFGLY